MQEKIRKVPVIGGNLISVLTQTPVMKNVNKDPVSIAFVGTTFMTTKDNVRNLHHQNLEKDARIKELEEQLRQVKVDEGSLQRFKASVKKVRKN
jgi:hypothetical protein